MYRWIDTYVLYLIHRYGLDAQQLLKIAGSKTNSPRYSCRMVEDASPSDEMVLTYLLTRSRFTELGKGLPRLFAGVEEEHGEKPTTPRIAHTSTALNKYCTRVLA